MSTETNVTNTKALLRSGYTLIHFCTVEERRAETELLRIAETGDSGKRWRDSFVWTVTDGFRTPDGKEAPQAGDTDNPENALQWILERENRKCPKTIYVMKDLHPFIGGRSAHAKVIRKLKDTLPVLEGNPSAIVLLSGPQLEIPQELEKDIVILDFDLPDFGELNAHYEKLVERQRGNANAEVDLTEHDIEELAKAAQGLTLSEAELAFGKALVNDVIAGRKARIDASDIKVIQEEKKQIVRKTGILTVEEAVKIENVGGLEVLKKWLEKRERIFSEEARKYGIPAPKGVLLTGVPGCGKSLCARAMADKWKIPILRLDMGAIFGGLVGASEANMRKAIACAKAMAPCVLMIDEIEKGLAGAGGGGGDGGTSTRVFGTLLTWMSDKTEPVFVVATANEFDRLPPEMLRKGRFDELFFVDFPHAEERRSIFNIHIRKALKRKEPKWEESDIEVYCNKLDLESEHTIPRTDEDDEKTTVKGTIVQLSAKFTGSEIEEAVKAAMIDAFADGQRDFTAKDIATAIARTVRLFDTMKAKIESIRARSREFTISASRSSNGDDEPQVVGTKEATSTKRTKTPGGGRALDI